MTAAAVNTDRGGRRTGLMVVGVIGAAQVASLALGLSTPFQPLLSILFVLTCPGFLLFDLDKPNDVSARLLLAIGGSLSMNIAIATVVLVAEARWIAPMLALGLVAVAALPQDRLRDAVSRITSVVGLEKKPQLALPASIPVADEDVAVSAAPEETQVGETVGLGDVPDMATLEVPILDADADSPALLDLNTADETALQALPGVGPRLAASIVEYRESYGPFETFNDLLAVTGIGPSKLRAFPDVATVAQQADPHAPAPGAHSGVPPASRRAGLDQPDDSDSRQAEEPVEVADVEPTTAERPKPETAAADPAETETAETEPDDDELAEPEGQERERAESDSATPAGGMEPAEPGTSRVGLHGPAQPKIPSHGSPIAEVADPELDQPESTPPAPAEPVSVAPGSDSQASPVPATAASQPTPEPEPPAAVAAGSPEPATVQPRPAPAPHAEAPTARPAVATPAAAMPAAVPRSPEAIDVNRATVTQLTALPGIGRAVAARIVVHRTLHGPFSSREDMAKVDGLGKSRLDQLAGLVRFSGNTLDLNTADVVQLTRLPGIGPELARRIVTCRRKNGPYKEVSDLKNVPGLRADEIDRIRDLVSV